MRREETAPPVTLPEGGVCLATALCDPKAELLEKARSLWPALQARFDAIAIHLTHDTHPDWRTFLADQQVPTAESSPAWDHIGLHRRRALAVAVDHFKHQRLLYIDPDHILRWVERLPTELDQVLDLIGHWDCLVIGRSPVSFARVPERLRETEVAVNRVYALMTGRHDSGLSGSRRPHLRNKPCVCTGYRGHGGYGSGGLDAADLRCQPADRRHAPIPGIISGFIPGLIPGSLFEEGLNDDPTA